MEDLREAATAYFDNAPVAVKQHAYSIFWEMDGDGNGEISSSEFKQYVQEAGYDMINPNFFNELDHDGNGRLDFGEFLTFFYVVKTRTTLCVNCEAYLLRLYFTCVECFERGDNSYDLCVSCYRKGEFQHHHTVFLDNYVMLKHPAFAPNRPSSSTAQPQPQPQTQIQTRLRVAATRSRTPSTAQPQPQPQTQIQTHLQLAAIPSKRHKVKKAFEALEIAMSAWNLAGILGCSIM